MFENLKENDDVFIINLHSFHREVASIRGKVKENDSLHQKLYVEFANPFTLKTELGSFHYNTDLIRIA